MASRNDARVVQQELGRQNLTTVTCQSVLMCEMPGDSKHINSIFLKKLMRSVNRNDNKQNFIERDRKSVV